MEEPQKLGEYVKGKTFTGVTSFPEGKTKLILEECKVEESSYTDDKGNTTPKWIIHSGEKSYRAGTQVMDGIQKAQKEGAKSVVIIKQGEGLKTNYMVVNTDEIATKI